MTVSIVIPVYNTERYVSRCLDSLVGQTFTDWECVLVDDCSTDGTPGILAAYAERDGRFRVYRNEENMGCGLTRRRAIGLGRGEWFSFVDSDDYVSADFLADMLEACVRTGTDIAVCGTVDVDGDYETIRTSVVGAERVERDRERMYYDYLWSPDYRQYNVNKLYRRRVIERVEYSPLRFCEDSATTYRWLMEADGVVLVPRAYYHYVHHEDSNSNRQSGGLRKSTDTAECMYGHWLFARERGYEKALGWLRAFVERFVIDALLRLEHGTPEYERMDFIAREFGL